MRKITDDMILKYEIYLCEHEKSLVTIKKYVSDVRKLKEFLNGEYITKSILLSYKQSLCEKYAPSSVNNAISALNSFFEFALWSDMKLRLIKIQRQTFISFEKELSKAEYTRLLNSALDTNNFRLYLIMQTICSTGIRISELKFITADSLKEQKTTISSKGKTRIVFFPKDLVKMLKKYCCENKIKSGPIFITKSGKPLDRSNIWSQMKALCEKAKVSKSKVFPHNLRHLFARTFYSIKKDIVRLADVLGHSSINTTRIYTMENGDTHRQIIQRLGLLIC